MSAVVIGAGIVGRLVAFELAWRGFRVEVFEAAEETGAGRCSAVAAGLLSPWCEAWDAAPLVLDLGLHSLATYPDLLGRLEAPGGDRPYWNVSGTLVLAHGRSLGELANLKRMLASRGLPLSESDLSELDRERLDTCEPVLEGHFSRGILFPREAQVEPISLLRALKAAAERLGTQFHFGVRIGELVEAGLAGAADDAWLVDARGVGARSEWRGLRAVRGEIFHLHAPDVPLQHMIRVPHPRHPIYLAPRPGGRIVVGATCLESDDEGPVTLLSSLELLGAACAVAPALSEAKVIASHTGLRPAFPDNAPKAHRSGTLVRINGLYRHGYLAGPAVAALVASRMAGEATPTRFDPLFSGEWS